jgi:hypothetical protein
LSALLADAERAQRDATARLEQQTEEASRLRTAALLEVERVQRDSLAEAEAVLDRARRQAATVDERARQELAWRRRQLRRDEELLTRRKQSALRQLASLSALAAETAAGMPEVPSLELDDLMADLGRGEAADPAEPGDALPDGSGVNAQDDAPDAAQNRRSSALSRPRSTS